MVVVYCTNNAICGFLKITSFARKFLFTPGWEKVVQLPV